MGRFVYDAASGLMVPRERRVEPIRGKRLCSLAGVGPMFFAGASAPAGPTDPFFSDVIMLWLADEGNGATVPIDRSQYAWPMTRGGTTAGSNAVAGPFGGTVWRANGGGTIPILYDFSSAPGGSIDWSAYTSLTVEGWVRCDVTDTNFSLMSSGSAKYWWTMFSNLVIIGDGVSNAFVTGVTMPSASWAHVYGSWNGGNSYSAGLNGTRVAHNASSPALNMMAAFSAMNVLGRGGQSSLTGYCGGFRVTRNQVRYSGPTYTVPAAQFPTS